MNNQNILIVTDTDLTTTNGVVTTLLNTRRELRLMGFVVDTLDPSDASFRIPTPYPGVMLARLSPAVLDMHLSITDYIHISTPEGPMGSQAVNACVRAGYRFTTGYHTHWSTFLRKMYGVPESFSDWFVRRAHKHSSRILAPTDSLAASLEERGYGETATWTRGVSQDEFQFNHKPQDYLLCVSRVSKEKNLEDFFALPGRKVMVGDGPLLERYRQEYPEVEFWGELKGPALTRAYQDARCFVFPSRADTFGVVMIEAMATGTPVAAYPVPGPQDVIRPMKTGAMHSDLAQAVDVASRLDRETVFQEAQQNWTWDQSTQQFLQALVPVKD